MCIIAVNKMDRGIISEERFNQMWLRNSHGFGMMWKQGDVVNVYKTLAKDTAYETYKRVFDNREGDIVLHFRIATQGHGIENVHPFKVKDDLHMCHNGIITQWSKPEHKKTGKSDTRLFIENVVAKVDNVKYELRKPWLQTMLADYVSSDKLAFLDNSGIAIIINEARGVWDDGNWYSNTSFKPYVATTRTTYNYGYTCEMCNKKMKWGEYILITHKSKSAKICLDCIPFYSLKEIADEVDVPEKVWEIGSVYKEYDKIEYKKEGK